MVLTSSLKSPWQENPERRAATRRGLDLDLAVVHLDDTVDHRQPDTCPLLLRGEVQVEDPAQVLRCDADTGVLDSHLD